MEWQNNGTEWHATARHGSYSIQQFGRLGWGLSWRMDKKHPLFLRYDDVEFCKAVAEFHANYVNIIHAQGKYHQVPGCSDEVPQPDDEASPKGHPEEQD